jgi:hypothetical protein
VSGTLALLAPAGAGDGEAALGAGDRLTERDTDLGVQVLAAAGAIRLAPPEEVLHPLDATAAPGGAVPEEVAEDVSEVEPLHVGRATAPGEARAAAPVRRGIAVRPVGLGLLRVEAHLCGVLAEFVVQLALVGIGEDLEGSAHLLELLLGGLVAGVHVRVVLARQLPVRLFDLVLAGAAGDAEQLVEVLSHAVEAA